MCFIRQLGRFTPNDAGPRDEQENPTSRTALNETCIFEFAQRRSQRVAILGSEGTSPVTGQVFQFARATIRVTTQ